MAGGNIDSTMVSLGRFIVSTIHAESLCIFFTNDDGKTMEAVTSIGPFPTMTSFEGGEKTEDSTCMGCTKRAQDTESEAGGPGTIGGPNRGGERRGDFELSLG